MLAFGILASWLLSASLYGGKVLSGNDLLFWQSPFSPFRPAGLLRPSNPYTYDAVYVFHPDLQLAREFVRSGHLPLWNQYIEAGRPLLASQQTAPLFPLTFLAYLLPFWHSLAWIAAGKLMLAALGTFVFARSLGLRTPAGVLAGISFAFGSYFVLWLEHPQTNVYLLLPWLLWLTDGALLRGGVRRAAGLAAGVGLALLGGHPESVLIVMLAVGGYALFRLLAAGAAHGDEIGGVERGRRLRRAAVFAGACLVGLAAGAVMVIPFLEAIGQGSKLSRTQPALVRSALATLVFPNYWGRADRSVIGNAPPLVEGMIYTGGVALLLSIGGLIVRRTRTQLCFVLLGGLAALVAIDLGPVDNLARDLPGLSFANLARAVILVSFAIAMLGAYGLDGLIRGTTRRKGWAVAGMLVAAILPFAWFIPHSDISWDPSASSHHILTTGFFSSTAAAVKAVRAAVAFRWIALAALVLVAATMMWRRHAVAAAAAALLVVAAVDLVPLTRGYHPAVPLSWADPPSPGTITKLQQLQGTDRIIGEGGTLGPNLAARYHLNDVRGHDLPGVKRYLDVYFALGGQVLGSSGQRTEYQVYPAQRRLLDVFGVRYAAAPGLAHSQGTRVAYEEGGVPAIIEDQEALPRAWVAYGWRAAKSEKNALDQTYATSVRDLERAPVIEGAPTTGGAPATRPTPARVRVSGATRVEIEANASRDGWLVLNDTYYPGWHASVDGASAQIRAADTAFRAIRLPAGRHVVTFTYRPLSAYAGAVISGLAVVAIVLGLGWPSVAARRRRRRPARPQPA